MIYSTEVKNMCPVTQGARHGAAPIPEEAKWVKAKKVEDISGYTHGIGWWHLSREDANFPLTLKTASFRKRWLRLLDAPV